MKKVILCLLCILFAVSLAACSNPSGVPNELYEKGVEILETADAFIDGEMSASAAYYLADRLSEEIKDADTEKEDLFASSKRITFELACSGVAFQLELLSIEEAFSSFDGQDEDSSSFYEDLLSARNRLAEVLGKPTVQG